MTIHDFEHKLLGLIDAMVAAANNPGGGGTMGDLMGMGVGMAMAGQMANQMAGAAAAGAPTPAPPPLPGAATLHVEVGGAAQGPYTVAQIQSLVANGQVTGATLVWSAGMAAWSAANTQPALAPLFAAPPPLPPAPAAPGPDPAAPPAPPAPPAP